VTSTLEPALVVFVDRATAPGTGLVAHRGSAAVGAPAGRPLTRARVAAGLTLTELARAVHVTRPTVAMWEAGTRQAARCYRAGLARALHLEPAQVAALFAGYPPARDDRVVLPGLARARRRAAFTQREVAQRVGVAATTVSMWESAGIPVPADVAAQLEQLLATDLAALVHHRRSRPARTPGRSAGCGATPA
jgi:transcriptional regulator with XRE-family HTH domain